MEEMLNKRLTTRSYYTIPGQQKAYIFTFLGGFNINDKFDNTPFSSFIKRFDNLPENVHGPYNRYYRVDTNNSNLTEAGILSSTILVDVKEPSFDSKKILVETDAGITTRFIGNEVNEDPYIIITNKNYFGGAQDITDILKQIFSSQSNSLPTYFVKSDRSMLPTEMQTKLSDVFSFPLMSQNSNPLENLKSSTLVDQDRNYCVCMCHKQLMFNGNNKNSFDLAKTKFLFDPSMLTSNNNAIKNYFDNKPDYSKNKYVKFQQPENELEKYLISDKLFNDSDSVLQ